MVIEFSSDGRYLAVLQKKINIIDIWELEEETNIIDYLQSMTNHYSGEQSEDDVQPIICIEGNESFLKTKKLEFDLNNRFIMCYSQKVVNIINLETKEILYDKQFTLDT